MMPSRRRSLLMKGVFAFMAFLMSFGFILSQVGTVPIFQDFFQSDTGPEAQIEDARKELREGNPNPEEKMELLIKIAASYYSLTAVPEGEKEPPKDAEENLDKAIDTMEEALALKATGKEVEKMRHDGELQLAAWYGVAGDAKKAEELYAKLVKADPEDTRLLLAWGQAAQQAGNTQTALLAYQKYMKLNPDDPLNEELKTQIKELKKQAAGGGAPAGGAPPVTVS